MPGKTQAKNRRRARGPDADRLVIEGDWHDAVKRAVGVKRPAEGWPKPATPRAGGKKAGKRRKATTGS